MLKKSDKKGFTLAELLIVVAIIAVLTAIAVPLFVGALSDAEERTFEANQHAVKSAAVAYILEHKMDLSTVKDKTKKIQATGTFSDKGDFTGVKVELVDAKTGDADKPVPETQLSAWKTDKKTIVVEVKMTDISA